MTMITREDVIASRELQERLGVTIADDGQTVEIDWESDVWRTVPADPVDWLQGRWWRVIAPDGSLWVETSNPEEAREKMRKGDRLERQYVSRSVQQ